MRKIKEVMIGGPDSPVIKEDWDITPNTVTTVPDLVIVDTANCTVSPDGFVVADVTGVNTSALISAVKTNITMRNLETNKTIRFAYRVDDAPTIAPFMIAIMIAPSSRTAAQVVAELNSIFFLGNSLSNNRILQYSLSFNTTYNAPTTYRIPNAVTPNGVVGNFANTVADLADLEIGSQSGMLLSRRNDKLYIGRFDVHSDGIHYDLNGREAVINSPVFSDDMTVFFLTLVADLGDGLQNVAYTPSLDIDSPGYDITGTSVEATTLPDRPDWVNFANPIRPSYVQTLQATLPIDVRIGQFYRVLINPAYTGPDPTPYGYPLKHNQTVLINSITGNGSITAYVDNESLITLTNDLLAPITQQQVLFAQSLTDISTLLQQTNADVNVALLNAPEIIAYVKSEQLLTGNQVTLNFSTAVAFNTFDDAYNYLVALPRFIKKRIVFEDRPAPYNIYYGAEGAIYHLMQNNIVLTSYTKFCRLQIPENPLYNETHLIADVTSLHLESFIGNWLPVTIPLPMHLFNNGDVDDNVPATDAFLSRLFIGDDCTFTMSSSMGDFSTHSALIKVGDRSTLYFNLNDNIDLGTVLPIIFSKGKGATIVLSNSGGGSYAPGMTFIYVRSECEYINDQFNGLGVDKIYYEFRNIDPLQAFYPGALIVRHQSQMGIPNYQGRYTLYQPRYVFATSIDLADFSLHVPEGQSTTIQSAGNITISSNGITPLIVEGTCVDHGVHFTVVPTGGTAPVIASSGYYYRYGGELTGNVLFSATTGQFNGGVFHMDGVRHTLWPSETEITQPSSVTGMPDFQITNLHLEKPLGNTPLFTFNINTLAIDYKFVIDGVYGNDRYSAFGLVNIINAFGKVSPDITETISIKNINLKSYGMENSRPLVTRDGLPYDISTDPVFDYDNRKLGLLVTGASGNAAGINTGSPISPLTIDTISEFGFYRDVNFPSLFRYKSRKKPRRFLFRLRANVYRTVSSGNAVVGIGIINPGTNAVDRHNTTFTLTTANTRVPVEIAFIADAPPFNHQVAIFGGLTGDNNPLYFENIEFSIQET